MLSKVVLFIFLAFSLTMNAQLFNTFNWKHLGPFTTPISTANTNNWTATGQGWIEDVLITDKYWYAAAMTGGVYRSRNEGRTWKKVDNDSVQLGTLCLYAQEDIIYRGTGRTHHGQDFGTGILQSKNNGRSWQNTGLAFQYNEKKIVWDIKGMGKHLMAVTDQEIWSGRVGESKEWEKVLTKEGENFRSITYDVYDAAHILVGGKELYESTDGGNSFNIITDKLSLPSTEEVELERIAICQDPVTSARWLAFYGAKRKGYVDESIDNGKTWTNIYMNKKVERADKHHTEISLVPGIPGAVILGTFRAYVSTDSGKTFEISTMPLKGNKKFAHDDIRGINTTLKGTIFLATDGGVFRSTDTGSTWQNKSGKGLVVHQVYGLHILPDKKLLIGCQDLGYMYCDAKEWKQYGRHYGDGGDALSTSQGIYIIVGGRIRLIDSISSTRYSNAHPNDRSNPFVAYFYRHPTDLSTFYYVGSTIWKNTDGKWEGLTNKIDGQDQLIQGFDVNRSNPLQLFFSFDQPTWSTSNLKGKLYKSADGGESWEDITAKLAISAWHHVTDIVSNPNDPNEVYACLGRMDSDQLNKVYKSIDGGETWENFSDGLTKYETIKLRYVPNTNVLIISTVAGFYYRKETMSTWKQVSGKIPNMETRDFEVDEKGKYLYAGTYGNGVWRLRIPKKWHKD